MNTKKPFRLNPVVGIATFVAVACLSELAAADVTLIDKEGWEVFTNGRIQTFLNYSQGNGSDGNTLDGNGGSARLIGGGVHASGSGLVELPENYDAATEKGTVQELRVRTGFVGNVLGFGVRRKLGEDLTVTGYYGMASIINTFGRRKYLTVNPDARETHATISGSFGSLRFGRQGSLFSRGATELTYLYGFSYGLGWPGSVSGIGDKDGNTGSAHVGFGVMGNGFGGGIVYTTPNMGGLEVNLGVYDALSLPGTFWERTRWPRVEMETTFTVPIGDADMIKAFVNGAYQKLYQKDGPKDANVYGVGFGARAEFGPFHIGAAGHYGTGIGMSYAFDPNEIVHDSARTNDFRTFDGGYLQAMLSLGSVDISAGAGITRAHLLDTDLTDFRDHDGTPGNDGDDVTVDPATGMETPGTDGIPDPTALTFLKHQAGLSAGVTYHVADNLHVAVDFFLASMEWYDTQPVNPDGPFTQDFVVGNAGLTYDW